MVLVSTVVAGVLSALMGVPAAAASDAPPPGSLIVDVVTVAGSGCPAGSAAFFVAPDNSAIGIEWLNQSDPVTSQPAGVRRNCQTSLRILAPPGYSYGVVADSHQWDVNLDAEESLTLRTQHYFAGGGLGAPVTHTVVGPFSDVWEPGASYDPPVMSPCGQPVNLNLASTTLVAGGTVDLWRISSTYQLTWTTC